MHKEIGTASCLFRFDLYSLGYTIASILGYRSINDGMSDRSKLVLSKSLAMQYLSLFGQMIEDRSRGAVYYLPLRAHNSSKLNERHGLSFAFTVYSFSFKWQEIILHCFHDDTTTKLVLGFWVKRIELMRRYILEAWGNPQQRFNGFFVSFAFSGSF